MTDKRDSHFYENDAALIDAMLEGDSTAFETAVALYCQSYYRGSLRRRDCSGCLDVSHSVIE
jgi:hypothetical protein